MKNNLTEKTSQLYRSMRAYRGKSQDEVYQKTKISKSTLSAIESGKGNPRLETLESIADALECELHITFEPAERN